MHSLPSSSSSSFPWFPSFLCSFLSNETPPFPLSYPNSATHTHTRTRRHHHDVIIMSTCTILPLHLLCCHECWLFCRGHPSRCHCNDGAVLGDCASGCIRVCSRGAWPQGSQPCRRSRVRMTHTNQRCRILLTTLEDTWCGDGRSNPPSPITASSRADSELLPHLC